jgi:demethylmenaquinone methyltransferase/2-methoxy-6-polyprenyl-1,4-benzoquinol methylase
MKLLESAPSRYDRGIRLLTLGQVDRSYDRLAGHIQAGQRVLDIGCGTGALTLRAARRGAQVVGIDVNAQMLAIAQSRVNEAELGAVVELREMGVAELGSELAKSYDVVTSGLCFSELTESERAYALREAYRALKPDGLLLLADEVVPERVLYRLAHGLIRLPLAVLTYALTQTTSRAVQGLPGMIQDAGFEIQAQRQNRLGSFVEWVGRKPQKAKS